MTTSQKMPLLASALDPELEGKRIPKQQLEYFQARLMMRVYSMLQSTFYRLVRERGEKLSKAYLAKRLGTGADQISRWMNAPSNLELKTVSNLLLAMGHEPVLDVRDLEEGALPPTKEAWLRPLSTQKEAPQLPMDSTASIEKQPANPEAALF